MPDFDQARIYNFKGASVGETTDAPLCSVKCEPLRAPESDFSLLLVLCIDRIKKSLKTAFWGSQGASSELRRGGLSIWWLI